MNLFSFINEYGCYTFDEVSFTEVDNVIMSMLSYLDLNGIVSGNRFNPKKLSVVGNEFFNGYNKKEKNVFIIKSAIKILRYVKDTRRYGDLLLYNYVYKTSGDSQFGALTIEINKKLVYVSFEGTDHLIGGWREDFMFSYMFPVMSQKKAIDYVNRNFLFRRKNIILGGHSKGGNLALVAGMYANFFVRDKIVSVYSNDGPGLMDEQFNSKYYKNIANKLIHIIPTYSVVGLLMRHGDDIEIVSSFKKSMFSHNPVTWVVEGKFFKRDKLSLYSKVLDNDLDMWLKRYSIEERKDLINALFNIFDVLGINSLFDLINNKKLIFKIIDETKDFDDKTVEMLKSFISVIFKSVADVTKEEIKAIFVKK